MGACTHPVYPLPLAQEQHELLATRETVVVRRGGKDSRCSFSDDVERINKFHFPNLQRDFFFFYLLKKERSVYQGPRDYHLSLVSCHQRGMLSSSGYFITHRRNAKKERTIGTTSGIIEMLLGENHPLQAISAVPRLQKQ